MTPQERQRQRAVIARALRAVLLPMLRLGLRPRMTNTEWAALVEAAYPAVYRARMDYWRLAERAYRDERDRVLDEDSPIEFPRRNYPPEALDAGLREMVRPRLDALDEDDPVPTVVVEEAVAVADRHARDGGRQGIIDAARHDRRALGYARRLTGAYNCAFCTMLASRGPVYRSVSSALIRHIGRGRNAVPTGEPFHDHCDCEVVPVFRRNDWEGRDQYLELSRMWDEHANGTLADWRRYLDQRQREQQDEGARQAA
ncbi:VG15 protein [Marinitenerispora sediminis]|uniref:Minor capsid protein n=1 Tax=Marinitenerispora sediminis TaxID=1931232 RepID=A0A368T710_9ACTN|nr:hypothetical protein [Marinitenerispora sediminis]RCV53477.1 hypothetical protein DEF23_17510 [Marinitenerispora sediminis]RCV59305.1 hypothetical protein DEF24_10050 [Marinitenerispora sediminis]